MIAGEPPRGPALIAWIEATAQSRPKAALTAVLHNDWPRRSIRRRWERKPSNPRYDRPPDLALLRAEIEKLALAAHPGRSPSNMLHC